MLKFSFYGHSCFCLDDGTHKVLTDPFLTGNPKAAITADKVEADTILLSHAHGDHLGDAPEIAGHTGAELVGVPEVLALCDARVKGLKSHPMNLGGSLTLPFGKVRMTLAQHSSGVPGGIACGYVDNGVLLIKEVLNDPPEFIPALCRRLGAKSAIVRRPDRYGSPFIAAYEAKDFPRDTVWDLALD